MRKHYIALLTAIALPLLAADEDIKLDSSTLGGLRARSIGPAVMGGRIAAMDGHATADAPVTVYVGAAGGGIWKSTDGGTSFKPVFEEHIQSIGAIAIDHANPQTVWASTGESWVRNSVSVGNGVYKTTDGGATWTSVGLTDTEHIARIAVHPKKSDTVYVCATGHAWDANEERGVFRTTDGGKTWKKVLYVDKDTGCADISQDPGDPNILYAGMWQFRRRADNFNSGGPGSALYRTKDGGETWEKLNANAASGLPKGPLGRIAVAVAPSRPSTLYAVVEAKKTALYRSDDLGEHWREMNDSFNIQVRPFYFAYVVVDPSNHERVYKPGYNLTFSDDGGKTFMQSAFSSGVHPDHHALWINPRNTNELFVGTDGGVYQSFDKAQRWRFLNVLPVSQFYHVNFDLDVPYNVYGGLQDNGTWMGPSQAPGGVSNHDWKAIGSGDGFAVTTDPTEPDIVYLESQGGRIVRYRRSTGEAKEIYPYATQDESKLRFNWNTPIYASPTQKGTIYIGSQFLMRSRDRGESWERISGDLTTNDKSGQKQLESGGLTVDNSSAENYTTIITISESIKNANVIWVGTDDGNVQLTKDGGKSWTNVGGNVPGLPKRTWVSRVEAGHFDENVAYATFDGHRTGDMKTYVYRTRDAGKSWEALATADLKGYAQVIREDLINPNLLFLGTEMGLYMSLDAGKNWAQFKENFPPAPVYDIALHPRDGDAVIGTHGRGIYIIDDLSPLRALTPDQLAKDVVMLPSRPSLLGIPAYGGRMEGDDLYSAGEVADVASITYYLKKRHIVGDSKVEIYDPSGKLISTIPAGKRRGINRVDWPMRAKAPKMPAGSSIVFSGGAFYGPRAQQGEYTVKLIKGKETYTSKITLAPDPRATYTAEERGLQQKTVRRLYDMLADFTFLTERVKSLRDQANARAEKLSGAEKKKVAAFASKMDEQYKTLVATREGGWLSGEEQLREQIGALYGAINSFDGPPTDSQIAETERVAGELAKKITWFDSTSKELAEINRTLASKKLETLTVLAREEWEKKESGVIGGTTKNQFRAIVARPMTF